MSCGRILIFSASPLCRNPRVLKEATTLGAAGYEVTVLNLAISARYEHLDRELLRGQPFRREVLDLSVRRGARPLVQRTRTWLARQLCSRFGVDSPEALGPASALLRHARRLPADLTLAHCEIPLWASQRLMRDGRRVAVDLEDWYSEDLLPEDRRSRPLKLLRDSEGFALRHCAYVSCPSRSMANALAETYHCAPPVVLRNVFPLQPAVPQRDASSARATRLVWFSQTIGPGRGLERLLSGWALTGHASDVHLIGDLRSGYRDELLAQLPAERRDRVRFIPAVKPAELPATLAQFDVGLALEQTNPKNKDLTISNKVFQYLNAGLAVIATETAGQREIFSSAPHCGLLLRAESPPAIAGSLDQFLGDPEQLRAAQLAARAAAEREFCWEKESPRLLEAVARALAAPAPRPICAGS